MKQFVLCAAVLLVLAGPLSAQSKVFDQTVSLSPGGRLRLDASRGSVRLTAWDRDQVEVHARIEADDSWDTGYARRAVEATTVDVITTFKDEVTIRGNYNSIPRDYWLIFGDMGRQPSIHYEIRAPKRLDLRLDIDRSNSVISGFEGRFDLEADRSRIDASDLTSEMRVTIDRGGDSSFRNIRGSLRVEADRTNLRIEFSRLASFSRIQSDRGDIDLAVSRGQGFDLDTSLTRRASIDTGFTLQRATYRRGNPYGPVNGGGPRLSIQADRGRVRLR